MKQKDLSRLVREWTGLSGVFATLDVNRAIAALLIPLLGNQEGSNRPDSIVDRISPDSILLL